MILTEELFQDAVHVLVLTGLKIDVRYGEFYIFPQLKIYKSIRLLNGVLSNILQQI